jgi:hypothetical protein
MTMKKLHVDELAKVSFGSAEVVTVRSCWNVNEKTDEVHIWDSEDGKVELDEEEARGLLEFLKKVLA